MDVLDTFPISNCFSTLSKLEPDQGNGNSTHHSQPLGNHYHDISCSNDIKCSFLHGNLQSCNYNNNNLTTKKQKTTAEGGHQLFFPCVFPAEKSQTKSRFNDLSGAVAAEFPGLMISMVASATPSGKKSHGKREILKW